MISETINKYNLAQSLFKSLAVLCPLLLLCQVTTGCSSVPVYGPDKQGAAAISGAVTGAGAGAITGFQLGAGTGPGALVGAGFGAALGSIQGAFQDINEEHLLSLMKEADYQEKVLKAQEILYSQLNRRIEMHPSRDIFAADLFFLGDENKLTCLGKILVLELAKINKNRLPYSRIGVVVYTKSNDLKSNYALRLSENRAKEISAWLIKGGIEPRRIEARAQVINKPLLIDPDDIPERYNQAIEFVSMDR